jgi:hypothetical protein
MDNIVPSGSVREMDFGIWIPVYGGEGTGNDFKADRILTYTPYLWVDNSPALVGGRTAFGFPKHVADMKMKAAPGTPVQFTADTWVTRIQQGAAERARLLQVMRRGGGAWEAHAWGAGDGQVDGVLKLLIETLQNLPALKLGLLRQLLRPAKGMPMVFLKEFPEIDGEWNACYQAVAEGPVEIINTPRSGRLEGDDYEVWLLECWSHDIAATLGLQIHDRRKGPSGMYGVMQTVSSAWMEFTARVAPGKIVWQPE